MQYGKKALLGFGWQTVLKAAIALVTLLKISILARLLTPADFGLFSLVAIALGVTEATTQTGINLTILQSKNSIEYFLNTAWVIALIRGIAIATLMVVLGIGLSHYFHEPKLAYLVALTALVPIIKGAINPSIVLMHRNMQFFHDSLYRFSLVVVDGALAITFGFLAHSVIAFIWAMIGSALFEVIISFLFFSQRPRFEYLPSRAKAIFSNTKWLSVSSLLAYLNDNLDDFLIGAKTTPTHLGYYHNAYALSHKANYDVARSMNHGTLPVFTQFHRENKSVEKAFFKSFKASALLLIVATLPMLLMPKILVEIILGNQWLETIPLVPWLGVAGLIHALALLMYAYLMARAQYLAMNMHMITSLLLMVLLILILTPSGGLLGAVFGLVLARALSLPLLVLGVWREARSHA